MSQRQSPALFWLFCTVLIAGCAAKSPPREVPLDPTIEVVYGSRAETFDTIVSTLDKNAPTLSTDAPSIVEIAANYRISALKASDTPAFYTVVDHMLAELGLSHVGVVPPVTLGASKNAIEHPLPPTISPGMGTAGFDVRLINGNVYVSSIIPGSGASQSSLHSGMELLNIGHFALEDILAAAEDEAEKERAIFVRETALRAIRGPEAQPLTVTILETDGSEKSITMERGPWMGKALRFGHILLSGEVETRVLTQDIGYVRLSVFSFELMKDVEQAFRGFHDKKAIILDLRGNLGGIAGMSQAVAGFLTDTPFSLGKTKGPNMTMDYVVFPRPNAYTGQVILLIDNLSASTSEILAAGLQGVGRATLIGSQSAGMVLPSMVVRLPDGGLLQYATALYFTPDGTILEGEGVSPDIEIPVDPSLWLRGQDPVIAAAIDTIHGR